MTRALALLAVLLLAPGCSTICANLSGDARSLCEQKLAKPDPAPDPAPDTLDAIDPALIVWDEPAGNVGAWPITATLDGARITSRKIEFPHALLPWPAIMRDGWDKPARGNAWLIAKCADGRFHAATLEWIDQQQDIPTKKWNGTDDTHGCLGTQYQPGSESFLMLSTFARGGVWTTMERTQIVRVAE